MTLPPNRRLNKSNEQRSERAKELLTRLADGDPAARDLLIVENIGLVRNAMRSFRIPREWEEDAFQEGVLGLMRAIDKFDLSKRTTLGTYATIWIRKALFDFVQYRIPQIRWPESVCTLKRQISALRETSADATIEDLAELLRVSPDRIRDVVGAPEVTVSIDAVVEVLGDAAHLLIDEVSVGR